LQRVELSDGDFIDLDWLSDPQADINAPILLLLHGLEGSKDSKYIQSILHKMKSYHWNIVVMHFRGCSDEINRLPRSYHSGEIEDLKAVLAIVREQHPESVIIAAGFSLGGNVLLKYLGESGEDSLINVAAAISVPLLLSSASARLDKGFSRLYKNRLLKELKRKTVEKIVNHSPDLSLSVSQVEKIDTFYDFDDQVTAPLHGFGGAVDYYNRSSSRQFLSGIAVPTLILHAADDPFMTKDVIPEENELSGSVTFELSGQGGHVGFIYGGWPWNTRCYIDERVPSWFKS
ncbi:MAG: hydrolase, partial [Gammaproteobacteria bacterium]|nr:hydrolase [Gammaproteobacteria bacterium]